MSTPDDSNQTEPISLNMDGFDGSPAEAVITTVAEGTGQSPLEMDPLFEQIDPDALNRLFASSTDRSASLSVTFDYCGQQVTVTADGIQVVQPDSAER